MAAQPKGRRNPSHHEAQTQQQVFRLPPDSTAYTLPAISREKQWSSARTRMFVSTWGYERMRDLRCYALPVSTCHAPEPWPSAARRSCCLPRACACACGLTDTSPAAVDGHRPASAIQHMASARPPQAQRTTWCAGCGAYLSVAPGARSVRCGLCHAVTRVERRPHGLHHAAVGFIKGLINAFTSPQQQPWSPRPGGGASLQEPPPASYRFPRVRGCKKRALLVGISYDGTKYELRGAVNDVNCMSYLLRERFGFPADCILVLTQEDQDPGRVPTRANLMRALRWLVDGTSAGDSLVFHFSGHGVQKLDRDGDEADGYDEALCPVDFEGDPARGGGVILDDEINATIVRPLGKGVKLHAIVDTCHSGTILDLPYLCRLSRTGYWQWENQQTTRLSAGETNKCTSGGLAISISGCGDSQTSQDTMAFSGSASTGAMTYSFIKAVESEPGTTYGRLLTAMRATIRDNGGELGIPGPIGTFFRRVITFSCAQEPQLCASETFDIYRKPFLL